MVTIMPLTHQPIIMKRGRQIRGIMEVALLEVTVPHPVIAPT